MGRISRGWASLPVTLATVLVVAGCGGGGVEAPQPQDGTADTRAAETVLSKLMEALETAKNNKGCAGVRAIIRRSTQKFTCPPLTSSSRVRDFEIVASARHGTGVVMDYTTRKSSDGATLVMLQTPDGKWALSRFGLLTDEPAVGTDDGASRRAFERATARYVVAAREHDCDAFVDLVFADYSDEREFCKQAFEKPKLPIVRALAGDADAKPRYLGGNRYLGFFALETDGAEPGHLTIVTVATADGALEPAVVFDAQVGPPPD